MTLLDAAYSERAFRRPGWDKSWALIMDSEGDIVWAEDLGRPLEDYQPVVFSVYDIAAEDWEVLPLWELP